MQQAPDKVKEYPISFKPEMVRAILEGRKTQTRRVVKPQPDFISHSGVWAWDRTGKADDLLVNENLEVIRQKIFDTSKYGGPGAHLWVKEIFANRHPYDLDEEHITYRADYLDLDKNLLKAGWKWKSERYMPRKASRIILEVINLRVERVQDITEEDAKAEGVEPNWIGPNCPPEYADEYRDYSTKELDINPCFSAKDSFRTLWEKVNGKDGEHSWDENPWVRVIEFRRIKPE